MITFVVIFLLITVVSGGFYLWFEMSIMNERIEFLTEKLNKLQGTNLNVKKIKPLTEGRVKSQIKVYEGEMLKTQAPPPPKPPKRSREW